MEESSDIIIVMVPVPPERFHDAFNLLFDQRYRNYIKEKTGYFVRIDGQGSLSPQNTSIGLHLILKPDLSHPHRSYEKAKALATDLAQCAAEQLEHTNNKPVYAALQTVVPVVASAGGLQSHNAAQDDDDEMDV